MSAHRAAWEVARRELVERSRSRVLRVSLALLMILSVGGAIAAARLSGSTPSDDVGLVGARSLALEPAIRLQARSAGRNVHFHGLSSASGATRAVRDGTVDVALLDGNRLVVKTSRSQPAVRVVQDAIASQGVFDQLRRSGLSQAQALRVLAPPGRPVVVLEPNANNTDKNRAVITIGLLALFMVLAFFGQAVAQGVTEEKSSRVVELLLTTVSPRRLLAGKVLGIGVLGLVLLLLPGAAALVAGRLAGGAGLPSAAPETLALMVLWFVLGYVFYSVAFAAVGALVSRQEDLNVAMLPVSAFLMVGFYLALIVSGNPNGTVATVAAFLPPLAPMIVPIRMVLGDMNAIGLVAAVVIDLFATAGLILLAARTYERSILQMGAPVKLRRVLAASSHRRGRPSATAGLTAATSNTVGRAANKRPDLGTNRQHPYPKADLALRIAAVPLIVAAAAIGFGKPISILLLVAGLLLLILAQALKHWPGRPAH
jgi:ABC-2 type transport system permease protein